MPLSVTVGGERVLPDLINATLELLLSDDQPAFVRGDINVDGTLDVSDGIHLLGFLFLGHAPPDCFDAADVDDGGSLEMTDAIALFGYLFLGGPPPPSPGPSSCGSDASGDTLSCASFSACP